MNKSEIKIFYTKAYEVVTLYLDGEFQGLFTGSEAQGVMRAFMTLKDNDRKNHLSITFEEKDQPVL